MRRTIRTPQRGELCYLPATPGSSMALLLLVWVARITVNGSERRLSVAQVEETWYLQNLVDLHCRRAGVRLANGAHHTGLDGHDRPRDCRDAGGSQERVRVHGEGQLLFHPLGF